MIQLRLSRVAIIVILLLTALPAGFRDPTRTRWRFVPRDALANVLLYVPFGLFRQTSASLPAVTGLGAAMSAVIEISQLFFIRRFAQPLDVMTNTLGAVCGALAGRYFRIRTDTVPLGRMLGIAALGAAALWTAAYFVMSGMLPAFAGRGTLAGVAFLSGIGFTGILGPRTRLSRLGIALMGSAAAATILLPVSPATPQFTFGIAMFFGLMVLFCTFIMVSHESRP
jgi:VanZ family protein